MKYFTSKLFTSKLLVALGLLFSSIVVQAQEYCLTAPFGYGAGTTGGTGKSITLVTNQTGLQNAIKNGNGIYIITQDITVSTHLSGSGSNYTLMALPGVKLINLEQNESNSGILYIKGSNIIFRNLTFEGPGAYDCDGWDNFCLDGSTKVWVDHCDFQDGCDGNFDIKGNADNITVTWCKFHYLKPPKSGGSGGAPDHRYTNLIGSTSTSKPSDGQYNVTYMGCWWGDGCKERMPRVRNALLAFYNCYWSSSVASYYIGPENAKAYCEGCYFEKNSSNIKASTIFKSYGGTNTFYAQGCYSVAGLPSNGSLSEPTNSTGFSSLAYSDAKTAVTSSCGAGATLTVTTTGEVSTNCAATSPTITLSSLEATATQNVSDGDAITNIVYTYGGNATSFEVIYKANGSVVSKPTWLTATTSGNTMTFSGSPTIINSTNTTYTITINSTDGTTDSDPLTATVSVIPLTPGTLVLSSGNATQNAYTDNAITNIVYTYGGGATGATVTGLPSGVTYSVNTTSKTVTISGTPSAAGAYSYTVTTTGGSSQESLSGTITVSDPVLLTAPTATYTISGTTANVTWSAIPGASSYKVKTCSAGGSGTNRTIKFDDYTAGTYTADETLTAGLLAIKSTGKGVSVASGSGTYGGISVSQICKLSGSGTTSNCALQLTLDGPGTLTVYCNAGDNDRILAVSDGTSIISDEISNNTTTANIPAAGDYYLYSEGSSINVYLIVFEATGSCTETIVSGTSTTVDYSEGTTISVMAVGNGTAYISSDYAEATLMASATPADVTLTSVAGTDTQNSFKNTAIDDITYSYTGTVAVTWTGTASSTTAPDGITATISGGVVTISGTPTTAGNYGYTVTANAIGDATPATASKSGTITITAPTTLAAPVATYTVSGSTANVTWPAVAGATSYKIKVCGAGGTGENMTINFSDYTAQTYTASTNLTPSVALIATDTKTLAIKSSSGTFGGTAVSQVLDLMGTGNTSSRTVKLTLSDAGTLTIYNDGPTRGSSPRYIVVNDGTNVILNVSDAAASVSVPEGGGEFYIYSGGSGINLQLIKFEASSSCTETEVTTTSTSVAFTEGTTISVMAVGDGAGLLNSEYADATLSETPIAATLNLTSATTTTSQAVDINTALTNITYSYTGTAAITWTGTASATTAPDGITATISGGVVKISGTPTTAGSYGYTVTATAIDGGTPATATDNGTITVTQPAVDVCGKMETITVNVITAGTYSLNLYLGTTLQKTVYTGTFGAGNTTLMFNMSDMSAGTYTYKLEDAGNNLINSQSGSITIN